MKRRRHKLEVSTFPFLAVLLCAMGSLILLLLVIDRRARAVATAKAARKAAEMARLADEQDSAQVEARRAEMERRKRALHALLLQQDQSLRDQIQKTKTSADATTRQAGDKQARLQALKNRLAAEGVRLNQKRALINARKEEIAHTEKMTEANRKELERRNVELAELENTLAALKLLRQRDHQLYSVVPYHGKRGDNRKPIYLECSTAGLIFHPDRLTLAGDAIGREQLRKEVERRIARYGTTTTADGKAKKNAYLLLLVRPDGIVTYYEVQNALRGFDVDFGYEFIDGDWVLDFPEDDSSFRTQPWMAGEKPVTPPPASAALTPAPPLSPAPRGLPYGGSRGVKVPGSAEHASAGSPTSGPGGTAGSGSGTSRTGAGGSGTGTGTGLSGTGRGGSPTAQIVGGSGEPGGPGLIGVAGGGVPGRVPGPLGSPNVGIGGRPAGGSVGVPGGVPGAPGGVPGATASAMGGTAGGAPGLPGGAPNGPAGVPGVGVAGGAPGGPSGGAGVLPAKAGDGNGGGVQTASTAQPGGGVVGGSPFRVPSVSGGNPPAGMNAGNGPAGMMPGVPGAVPGANPAMQRVPGGAAGGQPNLMPAIAGLPPATGNGGGGNGPNGASGAPGPPTPGTATAAAQPNPAGGPNPTAAPNPSAGVAGKPATPPVPNPNPAMNPTPGVAAKPPTTPPAPNVVQPNGAAVANAGQSAPPPAPGYGPPPTPGTPGSGGSSGATAPNGDGSPGTPGVPRGLRGSGGGGGGNDAYDIDPLNKMPASPGAPRGPVPVRPGWLNKNRDWIIPIECERDKIVIRSTNEVIPLEKLSSAPDNPLAKAVSQLIDGRQKMVPPGVPPWRPILQFQVHVDGSRAYFLAFPALDRLDYPKVRQSLDLEDVRKKEQGSLR